MCCGFESHLRHSVILVRIAFIIHRPTTPSARFRVLQFLPYLKSEGIDADVLRLSQNPITRFLQIRSFRQYDVVVLQKKLFNAFWFWLMRRNARTLFYEFDDCVYLTKIGDKYSLDKRRWRMFRRQIECCAAVITTNNHLAKEAMKFAKNNWRVKIIPNCVDVSKYPQKIHSAGGTLTIGWTGSYSTVSSLLAVRPQLAELSGMFNDKIRFKIISDRHIDLGLSRVEYVIFNPDREIEDLMSFDISICAYVDDPWSMGKAPVKILTSMACGIPVVAIDSTCARVYIRHYLNGMLAKEPADFIAHLSLLIESPDLRRRLGGNARDTVNSMFNITKVAKGYKSILESLKTSNENYLVKTG